MKKVLIVFFSILLLATFVVRFDMNQAEVQAAPVACTTAGKLVFHYQRWDGVYDTAGAWVWGTGTNGSTAPVTVASEDAFGAVIEVCVDTDADDTVGFIPIGKEIDNDGRWGYREREDGQHFNIDVTSIKAGGELHVYFFTGGDDYFVAQAGKINAFIVYFEAEETYEANLGVHNWGGWDAEATGWGSPLDIFIDGAKTPTDKVIKVGQLTADPSKANDVGLLIYAPVLTGTEVTQENKKFLGDINEFDGMTAGQVKVVYITNFEKYDNAENFATAMGEEPEEIFFGKVIVHYKKWDGDYSSAGLWTWNTGAGGSNAPITSSVTDDFGAVYEITVASNAADTIGFIALSQEIGNDNRWNHKDSGGGSDMSIDVTSIKDGSVSELHVYFFTGGYELIYINPDKINVITLYYDPTGGYEENLGIHNWGGWDQGDATAWGTPNELFFNAATSPSGVKIKGLHLTNDPGVADWVGFLIYAGDDATKKHAGHGDIKGFDDMAVGDIRINYVVGGSVMTNAVTFIDTAFAFRFEPYIVLDGMARGTFAAKPNSVLVKFSFAITLPNQEEDAAVAEFASFFSLKQGTTVVPFTLDYNTSAVSASEFVVVLSGGAVLDNTKTYIISFDNGDELQAEIQVAMDTVAPVLVFLDDEDEIIIELEFGAEWDQTLFPDYRATDDRDGVITSKVYVPTGQGYVNTSVAGDYEITLAVEDEWGNQSTITFTISVGEPESRANVPLIVGGSIGGAGAVAAALFFFLKRKH